MVKDWSWVQILSSHNVSVIMTEPPSGMRSPMRRNALLELVHTDVCQVNTKSHVGSQYFVTFIDDHSRKMWVSPMKTKDQVLSEERMVELNVP